VCLRVFACVCVCVCQRVHVCMGLRLETELDERAQGVSLGVLS